MFQNIRPFQLIIIKIAPPNLIGRFYYHSLFSPHSPTVYEPILLKPVEYSREGNLTMRIAIHVLFFLLVLVSTAHAQLQQTVNISSSPNPVGSGARALGMGGAFIGVADDATAASWNPAGLIQLETPEVSIVGAYNFRREDTTYSAFPEASGPQDVSTVEVNYLSVAYPFNILNTNLTFSLNIQHLYDFNKKVDYSYTFQELSPPALTLNNNIRFDQEGSLKPISPALAVQVTPYVSLGLTVNVWNHFLFDNQWDSTYHSQGTGTLAGMPLSVQTDIYETYTMEGLQFDLSAPFRWQNANFNVGLLWEINSMLNLGLVFKSQFDAHLKHEHLFSYAVRIPGLPVVSKSDFTSDDVTLKMPMSYGLGLALRLSDALTFDFDIYRTDWSEFVLQDAAGNELNPITGKLQKDSHIDDTTQVRFGGEYLFILDKYIIPVRGGIFYDPEPAEPSPDDFYGISLGTGIAYKGFVFDMGYQYRFGRNVRTVTVGNEDASQDVDQHTVYMSIIYHF